LSPIANGTETQDGFNLIASAPGLPNSRTQIFLNGIQIDEVYTDTQGGLVYALKGLQAGTNTVSLKIVSLNGEEL